MIPNIDLLINEIQEKKYSSKTYKIIFNSENSDRISGYTDDADSILQSAYLILSTERYKFPIYSWNYGVELLSLIGKPMPYVKAELPRRIKEALTMDDRISDVVNFEFESGKRTLHTKFTIVSNVGNISTELEVAI